MVVFFAFCYLDITKLVSFVILNIISNINMIILYLCEQNINSFCFY